MKPQLYKSLSIAHTINAIALQLVITAIFALSVFAISQAEINGTSVICYDARRNLIVGQECEVENGFDSEQDKIYLIFGIIRAWMIITFFHFIMYWRAIKE